MKKFILDESLFEKFPEAEIKILRSTESTITLMKRTIRTLKNCLRMRRKNLRSTFKTKPSATIRSLLVGAKFINSSKRKKAPGHQLKQC